jgi:hypothetical protein
MRKSQVDLQNAVVWIPDSKTPNGIAEVPLTSLAIEAFESQMAISGEGRFSSRAIGIRAGIRRRSKLFGKNTSAGKGSLFSNLRSSFHVCHPGECRRRSR